MIVFKGILLHFWKYKYMIVILTAVFFGLALLFTLDRGTQTFESTSLNITVVDDSDSEIASGLIEYLEEDNDVTVVDDAPYSELEEDVYIQNIHAALIVDDNIDEKFRMGADAVEVITDTRNTASLQLESEVDKFFQFLLAEYNYSEDIDVDGVLAATNEEVDVEIADQGSATIEDSFTYLQQYTNFAGYWIMLFMLMLIGNIMAEFNRDELKNRINVSPFKTSGYSLQMIGAQSVVALFIVLVMFGGGVLIQLEQLEGLPLGKMFVALLLISLFTLSMNYCIGALTTNKFIINGLANFISIGMAFLSGIMIPQEVMGETVRNIAQFLPLYHFTQIYAEADITWGEAMRPIVILSLFIIATLIIGMILENKRKSSAS